MKYLLRRIAAVIPVMAVVAVVVFLLIQLSPGDPAALIAGDTATTEDVDKIRRAMGLDKPLLQQFGIWAANVATGDLGTSLSTQMPVSQLIGQRMGPTLSIAGFTMLFSVLMAIPLGVLAAWHAGGWLDRLVMLLSVGAFSVPVFMIGYGLVYGFSIKLGWLPVQGYRPLDQGLVPYLRHLVLPCLSLGLVYMALLTRMTRATMLETLSEDYVRTARAKGLATGPVVWHALKNAANPIVTTIGVGVALLIGGVVVTETVFAIPGLGRLTIDAVLRHDYPVIQGVLLAIALMAMLQGGLATVIIAIVVPEVPRVVRLVRALVLTIREQPYIEAAVSVGTRVPAILWRHVLPNLLAPLMVQATFIAASAILTEAVLSFLGVGIPPQLPSWGNIMAEGRNFVAIAFHIILYPGLFLGLAVLAVNLVGDGLRDMLDPRLAKKL